MPYGSVRNRCLSLAAGIAALAAPAWMAPGLAQAPSPTPPAPAGPVAILDGSSAWRVLHSWGEQVASTPDGYVEVKPKDKFAWMTQYPPAGWTAVEFDDSAWCREHFFGKQINGEEDSRAGGGGKTRHLRQQSLRGKFTVTDPGQVGSLWLTMSCRGGVCVYVNGQEVKRSHLPDGALAPGAPAEVYPRGAHLKDDGKPWNWWSDRDTIAKQCYPLRVRTLEKVPVPPALLRKGTNVLAVEIHAAALPEELAKTGSDWSTCGLIELRLQADGPAGVQPNVVRPAGLQVWNTNLAEQVTEMQWADPHEPLKPIRLAGARNGCFTGRVMVSSDKPIQGLSATVSDLAGGGGKTLPAANLTVSYGRFWSVVGSASRDDALLPAPPDEVPVRVTSSSRPEDMKARQADGLPAKLTDGALQSVFVTARVPKDAVAGTYRGRLTVKVEGEKPVEVPVELGLADWALPDPQDFTYFYGLIQSPEGVAGHYEVPLWSDRHFQLLERSLDLVGQTGGKVLFLNQLAESEYGNEFSLSPWIRGADGKHTHDLANVEKYLDLALKRFRPTCVVVSVWQMGKDNRSPRLTVRDTRTGEPTNMDGPEHGTPEALEMWKPFLTALREALKKRGLDGAMLLGHGSDGYPDKATAKVFHDILPGVGWEAHRHMERGGEFVEYEGGKVPVVYQCGVWGQWTNYDPDVRRPYGWRFPYPVPGGRRCWLDRGTYDSYSFARFRSAPEQILLADRPGMGQVGADFWPPPVKKGVQPLSTLYGRFPRTTQTGPGNKACTTSQLLYPGPEGAVPSVRFELTRENLQECEARIFLEKLLTAKPCPLPADLAGKCQQVLDERTRWHRVNFNLQVPEMVISWPYSGWERRTLDLYQVCAEAAKAKPLATTTAEGG